MARRQDQGHEEGLVTQFRQGDGRETGSEGRQDRIGGENCCHPSILMPPRAPGCIKARIKCLLGALR